MTEIDCLTRRTEGFGYAYIQPLRRTAGWREPMNAQTPTLQSTVDGQPSKPRESMCNGDHAERTSQEKTLRQAEPTENLQSCRFYPRPLGKILGQVPTAGNASTISKFHHPVDRRERSCCSWIRSFMFKPPSHKMVQHLSIDTCVGPRRACRFRPHLQVLTSDQWYQDERA